MNLLRWSVGDASGLLRRTSTASINSELHDASWHFPDFQDQDGGRLGMLPASSQASDIGLNFIGFSTRPRGR